MPAATRCRAGVLKTGIVNALRVGSPVAPAEPSCTRQLQLLVAAGRRYLRVPPLSVRAPLPGPSGVAEATGYDVFTCIPAHLFILLRSCPAHVGNNLCLGSFHAKHVTGSAVCGVCRCHKLAAFPQKSSIVRAGVSTVALHGLKQPQPGAGPGFIRRAKETRLAWGNQVAPAEPSCTGQFGS
jgi:hypothetical protein